MSVSEKKLTGYPSIDKPWLKYYTEEMINTKVPEGSMYAYLCDCSAEHMDSVAIDYYGKKVSYRNLIQNIDDTANAFVNEGIKKGDYVTTLLLRVPEFIYAFYAMNKIGIIPSMEYVTLNETEILDAVKQVHSEYLITMDLLLPKVEQALKHCKQVKKVIVIKTAQSLPIFKRILVSLKANAKLPEDKRYIFYDKWVNSYKDKKCTVPLSNDSDSTAVIVHTGGTTGIPKGVQLTNYNFNSLAIQYAVAPFKLHCGESYLCIAPPFVGFGLGLGMHQPLCIGLKLCMDPDPDPEKIIHSNRFYKPTHLLVGPPHYTNLIHDTKTAQMDLSHVITLGSGGEKVTTALAAEINDFYHERGTTACVFNGYGMTETGAGGFTEYNDIRKNETAGIPLPLTNVKILDQDSGLELSYNQTGEIVMTTPSLMKGYLNNENETNDSILIGDDGARWIRTGDLGYIDEDGFLFIQGRIKRIYFVKGDDNSIYKLFPSYIESVLMKNERDVKQCAVIAITTDDQYYKPVAFVVANNENVTEAALEEYCRQSLTKFNVPEKIILVESLPITTSGKINYLELEKLTEEKS